MIFGFFLFSISLLPVMSYLTLSSQEKSLFQKIILSRHLFYSVRSFARIRQTQLLKILGGWMHGLSPPSQIFWGTIPQSPLGLRPWIYHTNNLTNVCHLLYMLLSLFYKLFHNLRIMAHSSVVLLLVLLNKLYLVTQSFFNFVINFCDIIIT